MRKLLHLTIALAGFGVQVHGGTIEPGAPGVCSAMLTGEITEGDLAQLEAHAFASPSDGTDDGRWKTLCLDSPGGSFAESMSLARYLVVNRIGTVVPEGATCSDECALLFMFGTAAQGQIGGLTHRRMHGDATLAFSRPTLDDSEADGDALVQTMLGFQALATRPRPDAARPFIDADLIQLIQTLSEDERVEIDTVNKAGRWGIDVTGFEPPSLSDRAFFHACQNMTIWPERLAGGQVPFERNDEVFDLSVTSWTAGGAVRDRYDLLFASRDAFECAATVAGLESGTPLPLICGYRSDEDSGIGPDDCRDPDLLYLWAPIPALAMFPADTPLTALADGSALPEEEEEALTRPTPCLSEDGKAEVINVNNFTSLRAEPGVTSAKVGELPLGSVHDIARTPSPDTSHEDHAECAALCEAATANEPFDRDALGSCVFENWMWFKVTTEDGTEGYASAKFLDF